MFLNQLSKEEKEKFISLSVYAAKANGEVAMEEMAMLEEYCKEMGIVFFNADSISTMDEIIEVYKNSDIVTKRIVILEMLGLLYADGNYDEKESQFATEFAINIGLNEKELAKQETLLKKYLEIMEEMVVAINI